MKIVVEFENQEELCITVNDTTAGRLYFDLTQSQHNQQSFLSDDPEFRNKKSEGLLFLLPDGIQ